MGEAYGATFGAIHLCAVIARRAALQMPFNVNSMLSHVCCCHFCTWKKAPCLGPGISSVTEVQDFQFDLKQPWEWRGSFTQWSLLWRHWSRRQISISHSLLASGKRIKVAHVCCWLKQSSSGGSPEWKGSWIHHLSLFSPPCSNLQ